MARFRCSVCGREFDRGALIIGSRVLCPSCAEEYQEVVDECLAEALTQALAGQRVDVDGCLGRYAERLQRLGIRPSRVKVQVLLQVARAARGGP